MLSHDPAFGFHLTLCVLSSFTLCLFVALFCEPSIRIEQLHADAAVAVNVVNPRPVHFSHQLTTKWRHQLYSRADRNINIEKERGSAPADLGRLGFGLKRLSRCVCPFDVQCELDRNSRASGPL